MDEFEPFETVVYAAITEPGNEKQTLYDHPPSDEEILKHHGPCLSDERIMLYRCKAWVRCRGVMREVRVPPKTDMRYAKVHGNARMIETVRKYLPHNYQAVWCADEYGENENILIYGRDDHGWTLDGYVIPRLASGLIVATELK